MKQFSGKALLVEDNLINQKVARGMLSNLGLSVDIANNGKIGVEKYQQGHYDIIFMDCEMPVMNGYDATRIILDMERERHHSTPIVALTANALEQNRSRCIAVGMSYFISKPIKIAELHSLLEKVFTDSLNKQKINIMTEPENPTFDRQTLDTLAQLMEAEDFRELIPAYLDSTQESFTELEHAAQADERQTIQRIAHSLKSASANLGAMQISAIAADLEASALALSDFDESIGKLKTEFEAVKHALQNYQVKAA